MAENEAVSLSPEEQVKAEAARVEKAHKDAIKTRAYDPTFQKGIDADVYIPPGWKGPQASSKVEDSVAAGGKSSPDTSSPVTTGSNVTATKATSSTTGSSTTAKS